MKSHSLWTAVSLCLVSVIGAWWWTRSSAAVVEVPLANPREARQKLREGTAIVVDARTAEEHARRHIPGSVLLPLAPMNDYVQQAEKAFPDKETTIYVYCRKGNCSQTAARNLMAGGYRNVYDLGSIFDWPFETAGSG